MSLSRRSMGWNGHCIRVFEEENLSVLWRNPPWSLGGVDVLFKIQTTVSFGVILRVVKFRRILDSIESLIRLNPWFIWNPMGGMAYLFRSSNESVLWLTLHRRGNLAVSGMNILLCFFDKSAHWRIPHGLCFFRMTLGWCLTAHWRVLHAVWGGCSDESFGKFFNGPLA